GAELDDLERLLHDRDVTWCEVVNLARAEDFLVVGVFDAQPALDDVAPVRARATAVRQLGGEELGGGMNGDVGHGDTEVAPMLVRAGENVGDLHPDGQVVLGGVHGSSLGSRCRLPGGSVLLGWRELTGNIVSRERSTWSLVLHVSGSLTGWVVAPAAARIE